jgi:hypothetical protein
MCIYLSAINLIKNKSQIKGKWDFKTVKHSIQIDVKKWLSQKK